VVTTNYTYDEADQLLSDGQFSNYEWDNNGNMDSRGTQSYGYDPANQLNEYVIDHNRSLPVVLYDETAYYVWGLDLIARIVGSTQQYYHYDGLGSTRALTGNTGTTLATYNYDVFGTIRSQTGSQTNSFLFTGEWRDPETGFYFLRARYYDPAIGRFINRDPWPGFSRDPRTLNGYCYVLNNPATLADPSGLRVGGKARTCPAAVLLGALGISALAPAEFALGFAVVVLAPTIIGEFAILPAEAASLYASYLFLNLAIQGTRLPCDEIQLGFGGP